MRPWHLVTTFDASATTFAKLANSEAGRKKISLTLPTSLRFRFRESSEASARFG